jgi:riboflavin biosynthesis pyrimidine reductase
VSETAHRLWPAPAVLDDDALRDAYEPDRTRPGIRTNFVTSLDGAMEIDGYSRRLSSDVDRKVFLIQRAHADAVLVGAGTVRHEGYHAVRLAGAVRAWRRERGLAENPTLVVVSARLDLDASADIFADAPVRPLVLTHDAAPPDRRASLAAVADVVSCGQDSLDLAGGVAELHRRGLRQVLCEGGPSLFGGLLAANLVDELCLTVSPQLVGPGSRRMATGDPRAEPLGLRLVHLIAAGDELLTRYARPTGR